jgi:hypothetical protein
MNEPVDIKMTLSLKPTVARNVMDALSDAAAEVHGKDREASMVLTIMQGVIQAEIGLAAQNDRAPRLSVSQE